MLVNYIHNRDSLKILKSKNIQKVDLVLTDPPYDFDRQTIHDLNFLFWGLSKNGHIVFAPPENPWVGPADQICFWVKPLSTKNTSKRYSRFVEMIFFYGKLKWNTDRHWSQYTNVFTDLVESTKYHPFSKPISLLRRLILNHTDEGDLILDPFCGSGNVCLAAKQLKCRYIGIDIDKENCKKTEENLKC